MDDSREPIDPVPEAAVPEAGPAAQAPVGETRRPLWRAFDAAWYLERHPEAAPHMERLGLRDAWTYYERHGGGLGHSPNMFFDEAYYLTAYPDVAAFVASGGARSGFEHYVQHGFLQRSPHWLFDEIRYRTIHPDLGQPDAPMSGFVNGYDHFLAHGDKERRSGHLFFDHALVAANLVESDAEAALGGGAFQRFLRRGGRSGEARLSWYFDPVWYLQTYPEVAKEVANRLWSSALHHYQCNRMPWRFSPNAYFSEDFYGRTYPDAFNQISKGNFRNSYQHFLRHGAEEGRKPHQDVDLARYVADPKVRRSLATGPYRTPFLHWLATRHQAAAVSPFDEEQSSKTVFFRMAQSRVAQMARRGLDFTVRGTPEVSVIVVLHDRFALTMTCLQSLRANYAGDIELILVDSGSTDATVNIERFVHGARRLRFDDNISFLLGCNIALEHVTAPAVLYLNNDLRLGHAAIERALARLSGADDIGAVGAKIIRTNGLLQEAGCIIWRDGSTSGFMRDGDPDAPEANFVRDVDLCSGAFLLVRTDYLKRTGGFDPDFAPAYYEETDLCVRLQQDGYRIVYDPEVVIEHVEYGTSGEVDSGAMIARNHTLFASKHAAWLATKFGHGKQNLLAASRPGKAAARILYIEDQVPLRRLGSGFVRSNDLVRCLSDLGYQVTVCPLFPADLTLLDVLPAFPDTVEVLYDRGMDVLGDLLRDRAGFYDLVWLGRSHNMARLQPILDNVPGLLADCGLVLDTEAVIAPRLLGQAQVLGREPPATLEAMLHQELAPAARCQRIIAVNERDAAFIRQAGLSRISVLGHMQRPDPTPADWSGRAGVLFLGALHEQASPNYDSLVWFVNEVVPILDRHLPPRARITIAGHVASGIDLFPFQHERVDLVGAVDDPGGLYGAHRVFVAPTRFAGGIPFKVHEAASRGVPVVATALLCAQLDWADGREILSGGGDDAELFAAAVLRLHDDGELWQAVRDGALARIAQDHDPDAYRAAVGAVVQQVLGEVRQTA